MALHLIQLALFLILTGFVFHTRQFPYADDWTYVYPLSIDSFQEFMTWLFSQYVDHRIPIQKALQYALAKYGGYDFRVLILFNVVIALAGSLMLIAAAKIYRGYQHWGDMIIPMILLAPMGEYSRWAFEFQFLSSILFVSASIYFACKYTETDKTSYATLTLLQLAFCALCGLNGAIFSTLIISGIIVYFLKCGKKVNKLLAAFALLVLIENAIIWMLWTPYAPASGIRDNLSLWDVAAYFFNMLPGRMSGIFGLGLFVKIPFIAVGLLLAMYGLLRSVGKRTLNFSDILLTLSMLASLAVLLSIAIGRSKLNNDHNYMHYYTLAILLPIIAWVLISKFFSTKFSVLIGMFGMIIFARSYLGDFIDRDRYEARVFEEQRVINNALRENPDIQTLVDKYILNFTYTDNALQRGMVTNGITTLRAHNFSKYALIVTSPITATPFAADRK